MVAQVGTESKVWGNKLEVGIKHAAYTFPFLALASPKLHLAQHRFLAARPTLVWFIPQWSPGSCQSNQRPGVLRPTGHALRNATSFFHCTSLSADQLVPVASLGPGDREELRGRSLLS